MTSSCTNWGVWRHVVTILVLCYLTQVNAVPLNTDSVFQNKDGVLLIHELSSLRYDGRLIFTTGIIIPGKMILIYWKRTLGAGKYDLKAPYSQVRSSLLCRCKTSVFSDDITVTSQWARWRLKSPASRLFAQPFVQAQIKENIKAPRHWPLWGESIGHRWIPLAKGQ